MIAPPLGDEIMAAETSTTEAVPKYFADFMRINAEQHGELGQRIIQVENRLLWKLIGSVLVIVGGATAYIVQRLG